MSTDCLHGRLRSGYSAEPLPLDSDSTRVMVNVLDPRVGGLYSVNGKDVIPVGSRIHPDNPLSKDNAKWDIFHVPPAPQGNALPVKVDSASLIDYVKWVTTSFNVSEPCLTRGMIVANLGTPQTPNLFYCYRAATVVESTEGEGEEPTFEGGNIPDAYLNIPYSHQLTVTAGDEPLIWSLTGDQLPSGLTLNKNTGVISGTPATTPSSNPHPYGIAVRNAYGVSGGNISFGVYDEYTLSVVYTGDSVLSLSTPIDPDDLTVTYLGRVIPMESTTQRGYRLIYDRSMMGDQTVSVVYDPVAEEIGRPATGYFPISYTLGKVNENV